MRSVVEGPLSVTYMMRPRADEAFLMSIGQKISAIVTVLGDARDTKLQAPRGSGNQHNLEDASCLLRAPTSLCARVCHF